MLIYKNGTGGARCQFFYVSIDEGIMWGVRPYLLSDRMSHLLLAVRLLGVA